MIATSTNNILRWIKNRLEIKYQDNCCSEFLEKLSTYFDGHQYDDKIINNICKELFIGFDYPDKDSTSMFDVGYTKQEKKQIMDNVKNILDSYHRNISENQYHVV